MMTMTKKMALAAAGTLAASCFTPTVNASEALAIDIAGLDFDFSSGTISATSDPLGSVDFDLGDDGTVENSISASDSESFTLSITGLPAALASGVPVSPVPNEGTVSFDFDGGGADLDLDLSSISVTFIDALTIEFTFIGSVADVDTQSLPFGYILDEDEQITFSASTTLKSGTLVTDVDGKATAFTASGTGEITATIIPTPTAALAAIPMLGLLATRRRKG